MDGPEDDDTQSVYLVLEYAQCGDLHAELQALEPAAPANAFLLLPNAAGKQTCLKLKDHL